MTSTLMRRRSAPWPHPVDGLGDHQVHCDRFADRRALDLDATQLEEVVDRATDAVGLVHESLGQALAHALVVLRVQRLREQRECADRRLQLVADVRDEVGAHRFETCALGRVVDRTQRSDDRTRFLERRHRDDDRSPRRTEQIDGATIGHASTARSEELGNCLLDERVAVTRADEGRGVHVAEHDAAGAIGDHDALCQRVERRRETIARCDRVGLSGHRAIGGAPESIDRRGQRGGRLQDLPAEPRHQGVDPRRGPPLPGHEEESSSQREHDAGNRDHPHEVQLSCEDLCVAPSTSWTGPLDSSSGPVRTSGWPPVTM